MSIIVNVVNILKGEIFTKRERRQQLMESIHQLKSTHHWFPWPEGLGPGEFFTLNMIMHAQHSNPEGLKSSEIGNHFHMSRPAVSQMLSSLEKKGFIERTICPEDRRVIYVRLKPEAKPRFEAYRKEIMERVDDIFDQLSEEEVQQMIALSDHLYSSLLRIREKYESQSWKPDCNHTKEESHIS